MSRARKLGRMAGSTVLQRTARVDPGAALFSAYMSGYTDSPRAIYEEIRRRRPDFSATWIDNKGAGTFPAECRTVRMNSLRDQRTIAAARLLVNNAQMPSSYVKRSGLVYVQTWHGTPLKTIGMDSASWTDSASRRRQLREYQKWDLLLSPNRHSSEIYRRALGFDGEILEVGYPRNDVLNSPERDDIRQRVRRDLGIPDGARVVLYMPTYRDDQWDENGRPRYVHKLDVETLRRTLTDDSSHSGTVLLTRMHIFLRKGLEAEETDPFVRDVSLHSEINELYLAADVLITDYSSAIFDFAVTGKPMLFYTYDLEHYRDKLRGLYLDLEADAPGPLCRTTEELAEALNDLPATVEQYRAAYDAFSERFCYLEDGHAAERAVDRILELI